MQRKWLIKIRKNMNLTQQNVAEKAGISRAYYTEIELGVKNPTVITAQKIAKILNISWVIFFEK